MSEPEAVPGGYEPDPEGETTMLLEAFFSALAARYPDEPNLVQRLRQRQERLAAAQHDRVIDEAAGSNLAMTLAVLGAFQELAPCREETEVIAALEQAFVEPMEPFVRGATRSMLDAAADPFTAMVALTGCASSTRSVRALCSANPRMTGIATPPRCSAASTTTCSRPTLPNGSRRSSAPLTATGSRRSRPPATDSNSTGPPRSVPADRTARFASAGSAGQRPIELGPTPRAIGQAISPSNPGSAFRVARGKVPVVFFAVRLERGGPWDWSRDLREQDGWDEHARFMDSLVDDGFIVLGGPLSGEREILHAVSAPSEEAVRERLAQDNWHQNRMLTIKSIEPWTILLDGRQA
jgi:hypothetical protein